MRSSEPHTARTMQTIAADPKTRRRHQVNKLNKLGPLLDDEFVDAAWLAAMR